MDAAKVRSLLDRYFALKAEHAAAGAAQSVAFAAREKANADMSGVFSELAAELDNQGVIYGDKVVLARVWHGDLVVFPVADLRDVSEKCVEPRVVSPLS